MADRAMEHAVPVRSPAVLLAFLGASTALHATIILMLPEVVMDRSPPRFTVMEVVLVQTDASAAPQHRAKLLARADTPDTARSESKVAGVRPAQRPPQSARQPAPTVLALPDIPSPESITISADMEARSSAKATESVPQVASLGPPIPPTFSAAYLRNPAPRYPLAARRAGEQGTVTLKVLVASSGLPARVEVEKSSGSAHLDSAALDAVKQWRFVPARRGTKPIESWVLVPVVFRLENPS